MLPRFGDPDIYPSVRFRDPELPSLHRVPRVGSPVSAVLRSSLTSRHPSGRARLPSPGRTACAPARFALAACGRPLAARLVFGQPEPHRRSLRRKWRDLPGSWGNPRGRMPRSLTPVGLLTPGHCGAEVLSPLDITGTTPTTRSFRGSIARPSASLSTLRRRPRGSSTQDSLPAGGQPLPGRVYTCRVPSERFPLC